ncbi:MAG: hypothetical protein ALECFALPRED_001073 [Alectoria fallacina]|uniref:Uncharacterized protein n=1 Tax=Alectoria fallacina TaxID=1903189 RepID=A0A8H3EF57_9LECA|nr:MAG: hypothetical protein ALECFALPRED_001073 [Alectoria fallacina]
MSNFITGSYETPSKGLEQKANAREDPPVDAGVASDGSEEGEIQDDDPVGSKRKRSPSIEQQGHPKRTKEDDSTIDSFDNMMYPTQRIPCVISIDKQAPFGSLYRVTTGFVVLLFLDPGRYGPPTVSLAFRTTGTETGKDIARNNWDTKSAIRGEWAMSQVVTGYATPEATDHRMSNPTVLNEFLTKDMSTLLYMRFKSWPRVLGFQHKNTVRDQTSAIQASMRTMFRPNNQYSLELWFIAPFNATLFRRHCLRYFTESSASRHCPLDQWQDQSGQYFEKKPKLQPPALLVGGEQDEPIRFPAATKKPKRLPTTTFARTQHTGAAQDTVTGSDNTSYQTEQSTASYS